MARDVVSGPSGPCSGSVVWQPQCSAVAATCSKECSVECWGSRAIAIQARDLLFKVKRCCGIQWEELYRYSYFYICCVVLE